VEHWEGRSWGSANRRLIVVLFCPVSMNQNFTHSDVVVVVLYCLQEKKSVCV
jgi:hypothetical protein